MKIRTRYAPSPTGRMHVGNLRTALYAYLITKHEGGDFLLRIEDTDRERFFEEALQIIYRTMKATGLQHDEGPDVGGPVGPYVQSERFESGLYMEYAKKLIEKKEAYYCFCNQERLDGLRQEFPDKDKEKQIVIYDKYCLHLSEEEVQKKLDEGVPFVIRQNIKREGQTSFTDEIYGTITVNNSELDDMILIKSDGYPTYNFANVVDDHLMGITHVVRGNEYLSSAPKYALLYKAFGWEEPTYIHCPLITNEEHQKLSKRSGHSSYEDLIEQGFLSEAIVNFVALLGWSPKGNQEKFSLEELIQVFDYKSIGKAPAVFDMVKLKWLNGEYIKAMEFEDFYKKAEPILRDCLGSSFDLREIAGMVQTRIERFTDIPEMVDFFREVPEYELDLYRNKKMKTDEENSLTVLKAAFQCLSNLDDFSNDSVFEALQNMAKEMEMKNGQVMWPVRIALSGKLNTPAGATQIAACVGKNESLRRIETAIGRLS